jgi:MEMO1 family protein
LRTLRVRPAAVAGSFYPADADALSAAVHQALQQAAARVAPGPAPKAIIAPHAGYVYSGPVAASAYARVLPRRGEVERVVLLGPAHRVPLTAVAAPTADAFQTPLGLVPVDTAARDELVDAGLVVVSDAAHAAEHSLEVHLPFLQVALGDVAVVPLVAGRAPASAVAAVLDHVWGGPETLIVVSTDLSHYLDQQRAREVDGRTAAMILAKRFEDVGPGDACGAVPLGGLLATARGRDLDVELLDLRTSADTAGDPRRVVGYGAFALR